MSGCKTVRIIIMLAGAVLFICQAYAAEFSADLFLTRPGDSATARLYVRDHLYRVEKLDGDEKFLAIENRLTDITTAMNPEEMTYMNLKGSSGAFSNPIKGWEYMADDTEEKYLGVETVNGFECDHYSYTYEGAAEAHLEVWKSKKLDHFIKYLVHYGGSSGDGSMEIRNVVEGALNDALFRIPDGYTREKSAEEMELERPAVSAKESSTAPVGRRIAPGGELSVKVDPELSTRVKLTNLIKDSSVCYVHIYKNGQKINFGNISPPPDETFAMTYKGERKEPMYGMQYHADEVRVNLEKGRVMATVFNEYSSFDEVRRTQYYISGGQGIAGLEGRPIQMKIIGDSPAAEISRVKLHVYEQEYVDGMEQKNTIEKLEFELKNGEEKTLEYSVESKANYAHIAVEEGGGVKLFFIQP